MKMCAAPNCSSPVFGKSYCKRHQYMRADFDRRSPMQKYQDNVRDGKVEKAVCDAPKMSYGTNDEPRQWQEDLSGLIADADALFSTFVRMSAADKKGNAKCYTCDVVKPWRQLQCGHYISRKHLYLRWDTRNARVQDEICNCHKHGNLNVFAINLENENEGITEILLEESRIIYKPSREEMRSLISDLTNKIKYLKP